VPQSEVIASHEVARGHLPTLQLLKQLTRKLGTISPEVRSRVNSLAIEQLESLGEDLLDFTKISDLLAWLEAY
jgi:hypothetical protein